MKVRKLPTAIVLLLSLLSSYNVNGTDTVGVADSTEQNDWFSSFLTQLWDGSSTETNNPENNAESNVGSELMEKQTLSPTMQPTSKPIMQQSPSPTVQPMVETADASDTFSSFLSQLWNGTSSFEAAADSGIIDSEPTEHPTPSTTVKPISSTEQPSSKPSEKQKFNPVQPTWNKPITHQESESSGDSTAKPTKLVMSPIAYPSVHPVPDISTKQPTWNRVTNSPTKKPNEGPDMEIPTQHLVEKPVTESPTTQPHASPVTNSPSQQLIANQVTGRPILDPNSKPATDSPVIQPTAENPTKKPTVKPTTFPTISGEILDEFNPGNNFGNNTISETGNTGSSGGWQVGTSEKYNASDDEIITSNSSGTNTDNITIGTSQSVKVTVTRIDARPMGHPLDSGIEPDPIIDLAFMRNEGAAGSKADKIQVTGPSVIRVPDWIPSSERTHPDAEYYMYFAAHRSRMIRLAWAKAITGEWHLFNRGDGPSNAWGEHGGFSGAKTPGTGVLDLNIGEPKVIWFDDNFGVGGHIASPQAVVDDVNKRIILYFHGTLHRIIGLEGTGNFVATSKWGLNFNLPKEGGEEGQGPRNVLVSDQYLKTFQVEGEDNGEKVMRTFGFVNRSGLWAAPIRTSSGSIASLANADDKSGYFTPPWFGDPTPAYKVYLWEEYEAWTKSNPYKGVVKAPQLVAPYDDVIVREKNHSPRHWAIYHDPVNDRNRVYAFYTCRGDMPESLVMVIFDLYGLTESERLDPSLWKRSSDVEQVLLKPELLWEGVANHEYKHSESGPGYGYEFRDPDIFKDIDGKIYIFYCGSGEGAIGVAQVNISPQPTGRSLSITSPPRGYTCLIGKKRNIGWESYGDIKTVDIEYTTDGKTWLSIATGVSNTHYYTWTIPNTTSDIAQVRVKDAEGSLVSTSDPFFIAEKKTLFILRPTKGALVTANSEYGLNWSAIGDISKIDLEYSVDNGTEWKHIAKSIPSAGPYIWDVPNIMMDNVRIRISESNGNLTSISDPFNIE